MTIFALMTPEPNPKLDSAVERLFANASYVVTPTQRLIAAAGVTAKDVSDKLGITTGELGKVLIVSVGNYYGRHSTDLWEWIRANWEKPVGG